MDAVANSLRSIVPSAHTVAMSATTSRPALAVVHGWMRAVDDACDALDAIHGAGLGKEAAPVRRLMLEHAVFATWLGTDPQDAVDVLDDQAVDRLKWLRSTAIANDMASEDDGAHFADYEPVGSSKAHLAKFKQLTEHLKLGTIYTAWLAETQFSHAGNMTSRRYLGGTEVDAVLLGRSRDDRDSERAQSAFVKYLALYAVLWAIGAQTRDLDFSRALTAAQTAMDAATGETHRG